MENYQKLISKIFHDGDDRQTRNAPTRALFAQQLRFNLRKGFPAVTTKKLAFKSVVAELLWLIEGCTTTQRLKEIAGFDIKIWDGDAKQHFDKGKAKFEGDLGPIYGAQWRRWRAYEKVDEHYESGSGGIWTPPTTRLFEIDQLKDVVERIKRDPFDRRLIVSAWNPGEIDKMALPPCHALFQFFCTSDGGISLHMYQRSCDMFLGVPFNIASYGLLLHIIAQVTDRTADELIITFADAHIYHEHFDQVRELLTRMPYSPPTLWINPEKKDIDGFDVKDFHLENYHHCPAITAPLLTQDIKK